MPTFQDAGTGLLGVFQGIQQARQRDMEIERGKELLKLEQDKFKLMEREVEQTGQSQLFDALFKQRSLEQPKVVGKSLVTPGGQSLYTEPPSLKDLILDLSEGATAFGLSVDESGKISTKQIAKGAPKVTSANAATAAMKNAKALVKASGGVISEERAMMIALVGDPEIMAAEAAVETIKGDFKFTRMKPDEQIKKAQELKALYLPLFQGGTADDDLFE